MIHWEKYPMARIVLWMVFAIYSFEFLPKFPIFFYLIPTGIFILFSVVSYIYKLTVFKNIFQVFVILGLSFCNCAFHYPGNIKEHILHQNNVKLYEVEISEDVYQTSNGYRSSGEIKTISVNDTFKETNGGLLLFLDKNIPKEKLKTYNKIYFKKDIARIKKAKNPDQVDFSEIYKKRNVYHQVYLKNEDILWTNEDITFFEKTVRNAKEYTLASIEKNIPNKNNAALANAMLIGYKNSLEKETVQAFIDTGLIHILAVSGMHVGLILIMIKMLLKLFRWKENKYVVVRSLLVVFALAFYAVLTGMSASVLRAVLMFSVFELGMLTKQKTSPYNSLATAAFILLCINPNDIYNLGFLLSFGAMLGIFAFYKPFKNSIYIKNKIVDDWIWSVICLSMAAQLGTLSISLFYFHQFPSYFLLANVIILPVLVPVITYLSVALVMFSFIPFLAKIIGIFLDECIYITIDLVKVLQQLPFAKINFIYFDFFEFIMLSILIIYMANMIYDYKIHKWKTLLIICISGLVYNTIEFYIAPQNNLTVYYQNKNISFSIQNQYSADVYIENKDSNKLFYTNIIEPSLRKNGILFIHQYDLKDWKNVQNNLKQFEIIAANKYPKIDINNPSKFYILSSKNGYKFDNKEQIYFKNNNIKYHSILQNNAFIFEY